MLELPFEFVIPLPIRSELQDFTPQDWQVLDDGGMQTFDLPPEKVRSVLEAKRLYSKLSVNDCFCLVSTTCFAQGILLTSDKVLRKVATQSGLTVHGILWIIDEIIKYKLCQNELLILALEIWKTDKSVFLPDAEIDKRLLLLTRL